MKTLQYRITVQIGDYSEIYMRDSLEELRSLRDLLVRNLHNDSIISPIQKAVWVDVEGVYENGRHEQRR